ncbi:EKA-like protein [Blumeria hordei DH14]|uniref:EKA-like protein n=1 Tax=Blumeria graminis f. sp. hordei (strain DH14) TaxID=546991 RepID=N1J5S2_BLUG1|nr:EKA-like protein [Blumeria hordei DH14]
MEKVWEMAFTKGLRDSCWAGAGAESSHKASTAPTSVVEKVVSVKATPEPARVAARNIAVPIAKRKLNECPLRGTEVPPTAEARSHPPEIEALLEAKRKRVSHTSARLEIGSTVLNTLEGNILSLKTTENNEYLDAMNAYLRGALAHFLRTGTTPVPTSLPPAPPANMPTAAGLPNHQPPGHQGLQ